MEKVRVERRGRDLFVVLDSQENRNALSHDLLGTVNGAIAEELRKGTDLRSIVYTHEGPVFCAGADLGEMNRYRDDKAKIRDVMEEFSYLLTFNHTSRVPTVAFVHGGAIGGGSGFALSCQYIVFGEKSYIKLPELSLGLFPYMISGALLRRLGIEGFIDLLRPETVYNRAELLKRKIGDAYFDDDEAFSGFLDGITPKRQTIAPIAFREKDIQSLAKDLEAKGFDRKISAMILKAVRISKEIPLPLANMTGSAELAILLDHLSRNYG